MRRISSCLLGAMLALGVTVVARAGPTIQSDSIRITDNAGATLAQPDGSLAMATLLELIEPRPLGDSTTVKFIVGTASVKPNATSNSVSLIEPASTDPLESPVGTISDVITVAVSGVTGRDDLKLLTFTLQSDIESGINVTPKNPVNESANEQDITVPLLFPDILTTSTLFKVQVLSSDVAVPEPSTIISASIAGLIGLGCVLRRRKRAA